MQNKIFKTTFSSVYPYYVKKAEKKDRTKAEVDQIICWLTGYTLTQLENSIEQNVDFETFFKNSPSPNPSRFLITGSVCGIKVQEIEDPLMREIRYLDKLIDELARGKKMEKILRQA